MRAAILSTLGEPLSIEEVEVPPLGQGHVLVRMQLAAVCHSQQLEVSGGRGPDRFLPHLIGHEGVGVVEEVGPEVTKVQPGDQVVLTWIRGSGHAGSPIRYRSDRGPVNAGPIATFCESPVVSEQCVVRIDPPVEPEAAVLAGCAIPTGAGTVLNAMPADPEGAVCIIGLGGVGLAAVWGAVQAGWKTVVGVDVRARRLERARELGATHTIAAAQEAVEEAAKRLTAGRGFDMVVECAGTEPTMEAAVRLARAKGGRAILVGNLATGKTIRVDPFDLIAGRWLGGSWGGGVNPDVDIPRFVRSVTQGALSHRLLLGRRFAFEQVNEAIRALEDEEPGRPILECRARTAPQAAASCAQAADHPGSGRGV